MVHIQYKTCFTCKEEKSRDEYHRHGKSRDGLYHECKACYSTRRRSKYDQHKNKVTMLKRRYDLTWDTYLDMLADQHGKCPICMEELAMDPDCPRSGLAPVVDHDHDTGRVRAILCADCNRGIGMFKENPDALWSAARYVIEQKAEVIYVSREDSGD